MNKLRRDLDTPYGPPARPLRIIASGTLFLTYTLSLQAQPAPGSVLRAHSVSKTRGGSATTLLSLLAQFPDVETVLVAPLGGNEDGQIILQELEKEGVITRYCKVWKDQGVPSAWVLHSAEDDARTVINHNPLPDITHEEFVSILGPVLAPENYVTYQSPSSSPSLSPGSTVGHASSGGDPVLTFNPSSPAPFEWIHFEGRSVKTTLSNVTGLDGLARERKWRSHCVFSVDVGRRAKQGVEALIPYADVLFVNKHYAESNSPGYATSPRAFLLSLTSLASPHALLVAYWGLEGAAVLSLPTREYFQSSGWVEERSATSGRGTEEGGEYLEPDIRSVRSGSEFWADGRSRTPSSSAFTFGSSPSQSRDHGRGRRGREPSDEDMGSQDTELAHETTDDILDEVGAGSAFIAGMTYALSRRILPGAPYTPFSGPGDNQRHGSEKERGKFGLDECLRFATELAGRKARRRGWDGLAGEMIRAGWFENA